MGGDDRKSEITIISIVENVIVTCNKIQASQEYKSGKSFPKFALFDSEKGNNSFYGSNNTFLGWYENGEELKKEIVAIKEASGNISQVAKIASLCGDDLAIYSGNDDQIVPILSLGGSGVISVLANVVPKETHDMVQAYLEEIKK